MSEYEKLQSLLNWKLLRGSHEFPGPDGGTCINEAAIVAAGFNYQKVENINKMPDCFSRVISQYLLVLNDFMQDKDRQKLLPYVLRLAGTADSQRVEFQRVKLMANRAIGIILYEIYSDEDTIKIKSPVETKVNFKAVNAVVNKICIDILTIIHIIETVNKNENYYCNNNNVNNKPFFEIIAYISVCIKNLTSISSIGFDPFIKIVDEILEIGNKAPELEVANVTARMNKIRENIAS